MDAKIPASDWSDPDLDTATPEVLLTLAWIKTNPDRNDVGAYRFSAQRFTFQTKGLSPDWHEKTLALLPDRFVRDGFWVLYVPFIRECLQLGVVVGKNGGINLGAKALTKPFQALTKPLQDVLVTTYPELTAVWPKPLPSPYQALTALEALTKPLPSPSAGDHKSLASTYVPENDAVSEGLGKGLPSPYQAQEKRREEKSSVEKRREESGECEGSQADGTIGALVPGEEEVLAFAATFEDLSRGWKGIPEATAFRWLNYRHSPKAGPWPRDWQGDLRRWFYTDVLEKRAAPCNLSGKNACAQRLAELRGKLALEKSPQGKKELRDEIEKLQGGAAA